MLDWAVAGILAEQQLLCNNNYAEAEDQGGLASLRRGMQHVETGEIVDARKNWCEVEEVCRHCCLLC